MLIEVNSAECALVQIEGHVSGSSLCRYGCVSTNHSPVITGLRVEREIVSPSDSCSIECIASDEDGDELRCYLECSQC